MYVSKHSFMWEMDFDFMKHKLAVLMKYDQYLAPINILRDLDIFRRNEDSILGRFDRVTSTGVVKKAMPWMVKCQESTLNRYQAFHGRVWENCMTFFYKKINSICRSIEIQEDRGAILNYLAKRLDWSIAKINEMYKVFPKLRTFTGKYKNVKNSHFIAATQNTIIIISNLVYFSG